MISPSAPALIASNRRAERRFDAEPTVLTGFGPLLETDSLVARLEAIWLMRPTVLQFEYGSTCSDTGVYVGPVYRLDRSEAARELRKLRAEGAYIERRRVGYYVEQA